MNAIGRALVVSLGLLGGLVFADERPLVVVGDEARRIHAHKKKLLTLFPFLCC
jgi:hypothetical protein